MNQGLITLILLLILGGQCLKSCDRKPLTLLALVTMVSTWFFQVSLSSI